MLLCDIIPNKIKAQLEEENQIAINEAIQICQPLLPPPYNTIELIEFVNEYLLEVLSDAKTQSNKKEEFDLKKVYSIKQVLISVLLAVDSSTTFKDLDKKTTGKLWLLVKDLLGDQYCEPQFNTPDVSYFSLGKRFTALRSKTDWLQDHSFGAVRHVLKHMAESYKQFFKYAHRGHKPPKFKAKYVSTPTFYIPYDVKLKGNHLFIPKLHKQRKHCWVHVNRRGGSLYIHGVAKTAAIKKENGKWYASVNFEFDECDLKDNGVIVAIDRNVNNDAMYALSFYSEDKEKMIDVREIFDLLELTFDTRRWNLKEHVLRVRSSDLLDALGLDGYNDQLALLKIKKKRLQRKLAKQQQKSNRWIVTKDKIKKIDYQIRYKRHNMQHQITDFISDIASTVILEDLHVKGQSASSKGTEKNPGKNVKAKAGLNERILNAAWSRFETYLTYKCVRVIKVPAPYTSQTNPDLIEDWNDWDRLVSMKRKREDVKGIHKDNRKGLKFKCVETGFEDHADLNSSYVILRIGLCKLKDLIRNLRKKKGN